MHYSTRHFSSIIAAHLQHYNRTDQPISLLFLTIVIISFQLYSAELALQQRVNMLAVSRVVEGEGVTVTITEDVSELL